MGGRRWMRQGAYWTAAACSGGLLAATPVTATTLRDALAATYSGNPTIDAQRAALRAVDEDAAIARSAGRPQAGVSASINQGLTGLRDLQGYNRAILAGAQLSVPLYQGGRVRNGIRAADSRSASGRSELRATEGDTFVDAVTAYLDVLRDRRIVVLNRDNLRAIGEIGTSSRERYKLGDVTRTDVSQSGARQSLGDAELANAEGQLVVSEQQFKRIVGYAPDAIEPPPPLPALPASADDAVRVADDNNPALAAAAAGLKAARYDVSAAHSAMLPTLSLQAASNYYSYRDRFAGIGDVSDNASQVGATLTVPLYQGGGPSAQVRQARDRVDQAIDQKEAVERQVEASVRAAFSGYEVAQRRVALFRAAVDHDEDALKGVRIEADSGQRQILDVLNAALELTTARAGLAGAEHDVYVAGFQLLNAMGLADFKHLGIEAGPLYDPMANYRHAIHTLDDFTGRPAAARGPFDATH